jgi:hypothetical protein
VDARPKFVAGVPRSNEMQDGDVQSLMKYLQVFQCGWNAVRVF